MKGTARAIVGYALDFGFYLSLLALELFLIAWAVAAVVGFVFFVRALMVSVSSGDIGQSIWVMVLAALFGALALIGIGFVVAAPYVGMTKWRSLPPIR
jgi:hypothetical protein